MATFFHFLYKHHVRPAKLFWIPCVDSVSSYWNWNDNRQETLSSHLQVIFLQAFSMIMLPYHLIFNTTAEVKRF